MLWKRLSEGLGGVGTGGTRMPATLPARHRAGKP